MADKIIVKLDKERELALDFEAIYRLDEACGYNALHTGFWDGISPSKFAAILWAMLLKDDPQIKLEQVIKLIKLSDTIVLLEKMVETYTNAMPEIADVQDVSDIKVEEK